MRCPSHPGLRLILDRLASQGWNADEMIATRTLYLPTGVLLTALQVLVAVRTVEFEFAHSILKG